MDVLRRGDWMQTYSGKQFWPHDPRPEDFDIEDIAHALANTCRFNGHTKEFYSVAQHSVIVSQLCSPVMSAAYPFQLEGLLHDAAEAYIGDMIRPIKHDGSAMAESFLSMEFGIELALAQKYNLWFNIDGWPRDVKRADNIALATEKRDVMALEAAPWATLPEPTALAIIPLAPRAAKQLFLDRFGELYGSKTTGAEYAR